MSVVGCEQLAVNCRHKLLSRQGGATRPCHRTALLKDKDKYKEKDNAKDKDKGKGKDNAKDKGNNTVERQRQGGTAIAMSCHGTTILPKPRMPFSLGHLIFVTYSYSARFSHMTLSIPRLFRKSNNHWYLADTGGFEISN